jgi:hypothetical protein
LHVIAFCKIGTTPTLKYLITKDYKIGLTLVIACGGRVEPHTGAARLIIVAASCGHGSLKVLLAPLFATFDALLRAVGGNVGRCLPVAAWDHLLGSLGRVKHDHLVAGGMLGGDVARLHERVPKEVVMSALS